MAIEIIRKLKKINRVLMLIILIMGMIIAGMFVHYQRVIQKEELKIESVSEVPRNTVSVSKRKNKKNEHNEFYKDRTGLF